MYHVSLSDFENEIIFFPNTTLINLPVSISNIVQRGIELGYNKNQLVILFKLFVSEYFSSYRYTLDNVTSQKQLFQQVLNIIHTQDLGTVKTVGDQMKSYPELYNSVFSHVTTRTE